MNVLSSKGFLLNRLSNTVSTILDNRLKLKYDITVSQWATMSILEEKEGMTSNAIQEILNVKVSSASGVIDRMEKKGLLIREANLADGRKKNIYLTDKSKKIMPDIKNEIKLINSEMLKGFSKEEEASFEKLMNKAFENVIQLKK